jgi:hypothetical protein
MSTTGNISVYKGMDPDTLYYNYPNGSNTFFYLPKSGQLVMQPYPTNHQDMLTEDDDLFREVFATFLKTTPYNGRVRREMSSRGKALAHGDAILGRIALDKMTPLIAFWENTNLSVNTTVVGAFLNALYKKLPAFKGFQDKTVLLLPGRPPVTVATFTGAEVAAPSPEREIVQKAPVARKKRAVKAAPSPAYVIDGTSYTLSDLQAMRAAVHTKGTTHPALCHPDIDKYPELAGYKPSTCGEKGGGTLRATHPQRWRQAGREAGFPYLYTPEHADNFKSWLTLREDIHIS